MKNDIKNNSEEENQAHILMSYVNTKDYINSIKLSKELINSYPENLDFHNILAVSYKALGEYEKAKNIFSNIIRKNIRNPRTAFIYNNAGNLYYDLGQVDNAKVFFKASLELEPSNMNALIGMGLALSNQGRDSDAIAIYEKGLRLDNNSEFFNYNIANSLRKIEKYYEASLYYGKSNNRLSKSYKLECLYNGIGDKLTKDDFLTFLKELNQEGHSDPLTACISSHSSIRFSLDDQCNFCNDPFNYIRKENLFESNEIDENLTEEFLNDIEQAKISKKSQSLLNNGLQTSGNLFKLESESVKRIKSIIINNINKYKKNFRNSNQNYILEWPDNYELYGWIIIMKNKGNLRAHMHKEGWLSSSIYLKMPKKENPKDGAIKFSLDGAGYENDNKNYPEEIFEVKYGDMIMFPSSLFHSTIPFSSNEERISLAFDIIPL